MPLKCFPLKDCWVTRCCQGGGVIHRYVHAVQASGDPGASREDGC